MTQKHCEINKKGIIMEYYDLAEDEVVLFKGKVVIQNKKNETELILTNKNFVFITTIKRLFSKDEISVDVFSVSEVKLFEGTYQVLKKGNLVEIYFLHDEIGFTFVKGSECREFMNAVLKLLTHKNKFERGAEKVLGAKDCVDKSLHIDSVGMVKTGLKTIVASKTSGVLKGIGFGKKKNG